MPVRGMTLALLAALGAAHGAAAQVADDVSLVAESKFAFDLALSDPAEAANLLEMVLHVSTDRGANWRPHQTFRPNAASVDFAAPQDGEFWFAVQRVYKDGRRVPTRMDGARPMQKVLVDTVPPRLEAVPNESPGRAGVSWSVFGDDVDYSTFVVESRAGGGAWTPQSATASARGQTQWNATPGRQEARVTVRDRAGNAATQTVMLGGGASMPPLPLPGDEPPPPFDGGPATNARPRPGRLIPEGDAPLAASNPGAAPASRPAGNLGGVPTSYVNTLKFFVNYKLEAAGKSGVKAVTLHWRHPDEREWQEYGGVDPEKPFKVAVDGEGKYGIMTRATSGVGLGDPVPAPGAPPQLWVVVDTTPPTVRLETPKAVFGGPTEMVFRWKVTDANPGTKRVKLSYAAVDGADAGRWRELAAGLDNEGTYRWRMPDDAPYRLHAKLDAEDAAGNAASDQTPEPVAADNSRPRAVAVAATVKEDPNARAAVPEPERRPTGGLSVSPDRSPMRPAAAPANDPPRPPAKLPPAPPRRSESLGTLPPPPPSLLPPPPGKADDFMFPPIK